MPRANRYSVPGYIWHLTHRCHKKEFLLKFSRDRQRWIRWLFEARKRFGLCVLNYTVTHNHIHLLVRDRGHHEIPKAMQLVAGQTAQQYNRRKKRKGAFWEDRYHATAVQSGEHLARCLIYIDLNMLRAGAVRHPIEWADGGYRELFESRQRYRTIDVWALVELLGFNRLAEMKCAYKQWLLAALEAGHRQRDEAWTESLAVGSREFVENVKRHLGTRVHTRQIEEQTERCLLKESPATYSCQMESKMGLLSAKIGVKSRDSYDHSIT
jgi:putative transposase